MQVPKHISLKIYLASILTIALILVASVGYVLSQVDSGTYTISTGIYPGTPTYTFWTNATHYFSKDHYGVLSTSTNISGLVWSALGQGHSLYFKEGDYTFTHYVLLPSNILLYGEANFKTVFIADDGLDNLIFGNENRTAINDYYITLKDLKFDGNSAGQSSGVALVYFKWASHTMLDRVFITDSYGHGVSFENGTRNTVQNSIVSSTGDRGIIFYYSSECAALGNQVISSGSKPIELNHAPRSRVIFNRVSSHTNGLDVLTGSDDSEICDNVIHSGTGDGIHIQCDFIKIEGNTIVDCGDSGIVIEVEYGYAVISDNLVAGCEYHGILIAGGKTGGERCAVTGNEVWNTQSGSGIQLGWDAYSATYNLVSGNYASDSQGTETQEWGITEINSGDYNMIVDCFAYDNMIGGISVVGANTEVHSCFNGTTWIT